MNKLFSVYGRELSALIAIILMFIIFTLIDEIYIDPDNIRDIIEQATIFGLMGIGVTGIIISGGIDLSVGSVLALIAVIVARQAVAGLTPALCLFLAIALGFVFGLVNGLLVTRLKLQPFIATMGTMSIYRGAALIYTDAVPVIGVPQNYRFFVDGELFPYVRSSIVIFVVFALAVHILLKYTCFGNHVYAVGGNEEAARLSGVRVTRVKTLIYAVGLIGTALAAAVQLGKLGAGDPTTGQGYELNAIAAAAIGGTSMAGGRGSVLGTVLGAILFSGLKVGLIVAGVEMFWQYVATGLVIVVSAYVEVLQNRISTAPGGATRA